MIREINKLLQVTRKRRGYFTLLLLRCPFDALYTLMNARFLRNSFEAIENENFYLLMVTCLAYGIVNLFIFVYNGTIWTLYGTFITKLEANLRCKLFHIISNLPYAKLEEKNHGEWITHLNTDIQVAMNLFNAPMNLPHAMVSFVNICVSSVILSYESSLLFALTLLFTLPHLLLSFHYIATPMISYKIEAKEAMAQCTTILNAFITTAEIAVIYDANPFLMKRFEECSLKLMKSNMKIHKRNALSNTLIPLFGMGGYLVLLLIGGKNIASDSFSFGKLTAAFQLRSGIMASAFMFVNSVISMKGNMAGIIKINETVRLRK